jgi:ketosteroid isomerase-like protein
MSDEDVQAVRRVYDEWSRGNWRPKFDIYDAEMEWGWSDEFPGLSGVYHDPAERNKRVQEWLHGWEDWRCEAEELVVHGEHVVALCRYRGRGRGSGASVDTKGAHVWTLRDGKVVRLEVFATRARAFEAVGLPIDS